MSAITVPAPTDPTTTAAPARRRPVVGPRPRLAKVLLVGAIMLLASSCTGRHPIPTDYGKTVRKNFLAGCTQPTDPDATGTNTTVLTNSNALCTCFYDSLVKNVDYAEFKKVNSAQSKKPGPLPAKFQALLKACQAKQ